MTTPTLNESEILLARLVKDDQTVRGFPPEVSAKRLAAYRAEIEARKECELDNMRRAFNDAVEQRDANRRRISQLETELEHIAFVTEPHWKSAGLKLESKWIIEEWLARHKSQEDENERLEKRISALEAALIQAEPNIKCKYPLSRGWERVPCGKCIPCMAIAAIAEALHPTPPPSTSPISPPQGASVAEDRNGNQP